MTPSEISALAVAIAGLSLTLILFVLRNTRDGEHRLSVLETKINVFWKVIEEGAVTLLHRDDTPEVDALLEKVSAGEDLSDPERDELVEYLREIEHDGARAKGEKAMALIYRAALIARYYDK